MNIKAKNDYVIVEQEIQTTGSIIMKENNIGRVVACAIEPELVGKTVIFATKKAIEEYDGYKFIPLGFIMAVIE